MKTFHAFLALMLILVISGGRWLAIGIKERADQYVRDGRYEAARSLLEEQFRQSSDKTPRMIQNLYNARIATGDIDGALTLLKSVPANDAPQELVKAALYSSFDLTSYEKLLNSVGDQPSLRELARIADIRGKTDLLYSTLQALHQKGWANSQELLRLSALHARHGNFKEATQAVRTAEDLSPRNEQEGLFLIELKLMAHDKSISDSDFLTRVQQFLKNNSRSAFAHQILWGLIKLNRPGVSLKLIKYPLKDSETFNAFVAAKESTQQTEDIVPTILKNGSLKKASEDQLKLVMRYAPESEATLNQVLDRYIEGDLSLDDKQLVEMAYTSMKKYPQTTETAERMFKLLVEKNGASHQAAQGLRYLWGPRPSVSAVTWISDQIRKGSAEDRQIWIEYLLRSGQTIQALDLVQSLNAQEFSALSTMFIKSVNRVPEKRDKILILNLIQKKETRSATLLRAAQTAKDNQLFESAEQLGQQVLKINSKDTKAQVFLGILMAQQNKAERAIEYLNPIVSDKKNLSSLSNNEKVLSQFLYASSLEQQGNGKMADQYYQAALMTLREVYTKDFDIALQAELLAKVEGPSQGAKLLLAQQKVKPLTKQQRILLGRLLTDAGDLDTANTVLFSEGAKNE